MSNVHDIRLSALLTEILTSLVDEAKKEAVVSARYHWVEGGAMGLHRTSFGVRFRFCVAISIKRLGGVCALEMVRAGFAG